MTSQTQDESTTGKHIPALDGIRGLAVLLVLFFHFMWASPYSGHNPLVWAGAALKNIGWVGVDLFFALSGFLITGILYDTRNSTRFFRNFYARRALRIFPLYYLYIALAVFLGWWIGKGTVGWWGLLELCTYTRNLIFPNPTTIPAIWNAPGGSPFQLNHLWSLAIEEQFYFLWPLLIFLLKTRRRIATAAGVGIASSFLVRLLLIHNGIAYTHRYLLSSWTPSRLDGLFAGALLAILIRSSWEQTVLRWSKAALLAGLAGLLVISSRYPYLDLLKAPPAALWVYPALALTFTAMIASAITRGSWLNRFFNLSFMRFFGRYSYGLYIYHYTVADFMEMLRPAVVRATHSKILGVVLPAILGLAITIGISLVSFHFFEKKFLLLKRKFEDHTRAPKLESYAPKDA